MRYILAIARDMLTFAGDVCNGFALYGKEFDDSDPVPKREPAGLGMK